MTLFLLIWGVFSLLERELGFTLHLGEQDTPIYLPMLSETLSRIFIGMGFFLAIMERLPEYFSAKYQAWLGNVVKAIKRGFKGEIK